MRVINTLFPILLGLATAVQPITASAQIGIGVSVNIAPPELPVYVQPAIPAPGFLWTPGYWAWGGAEYYWVPGTWVRPPRVGFLWTPPWWGFAGGVYGFHTGYWGPHIGFYGGINYGFGYGGIGYEGGRWEHGVFAYNRVVNNFGGVHINNVYERTVVNNTTINHVAFNGGERGIQARPTQEQQAAEREQHIAATKSQTRHFEAARANPQLRASVNHGHPAIAATARPGQFKGPGVVAARDHAKTGQARTGQARAGARAERNPARAQHAPGQAPRHATPPRPQGARSTPYPQPARPAPQGEKRPGAEKR